MDVETMPKVMLVEDDASMLSIIRLLLEIEGFEVVHVDREDFKDVTDILSVIRREQPILILLDVHLHKLNGFDLLRNMRTDPDLNGIRVLMSSGMDLTSKCKQEGADGFLLKPYMPDELIATIRQFVGV